MSEPLKWQTNWMKSLRAGINPAPQRLLASHPQITQKNLNERKRQLNVTANLTRKAKAAAEAQAQAAAEAQAQAALQAQAQAALEAQAAANAKAAAEVQAAANAKAAANAAQAARKATQKRRKVNAFNVYKAKLANQAERKKLANEAEKARLSNQAESARLVKTQGTRRSFTNQRQVGKQSPGQAFARQQNNIKRAARIAAAKAVAEAAAAAEAAKAEAKRVENARRQKSIQNSQARKAERQAKDIEKAKAVKAAEQAAKALRQAEARELAGFHNYPLKVAYNNNKVLNSYVNRKKASASVSPDDFWNIPPFVKNVVPNQINRMSGSNSPVNSPGALRIEAPSPLPLPSGNKPAGANPNGNGKATATNVRNVKNAEGCNPCEAKILKLLRDQDAASIRGMLARIMGNTTKEAGKDTVLAVLKFIQSLLVNQGPNGTNTGNRKLIVYAKRAATGAISASNSFNSTVNGGKKGEMLEAQKASENFKVSLLAFEQELNNDEGVTQKPAIDAYNSLVDATDKAVSAWTPFPDVKMPSEYLPKFLYFRQAVKGKSGKTQFQLNREKYGEKFRKTRKYFTSGQAYTNLKGRFGSTFSGLSQAISRLSGREQAEQVRQLYIELTKKGLAEEAARLQAAAAAAQQLAAGPAQQAALAAAAATAAAGALGAGPQVPLTNAAARADAEAAAAAKLGLGSNYGGGRRRSRKNRSRKNRKASRKNRKGSRKNRK